jgi:hypothetical protein
VESRGGCAILRLMRAFVLAVVILASAVLVAMGTGAGSSAVAKPGSCSRDLDLGQRHYRYARLPRGSLRAGARLPGRGRLQCEPALVCRVSGGCIPSSGHVFSKDSLRQVRGIRPFLAVIDARSGRVYVNRAIFTVVMSPKFLLRDLRRGGEAQGDPDHNGGPPESSLRSSGSTPAPLAWGSYCWTTLLTGNQSVRQCWTLVPPSLRFDLPLVIAEPGATLQGLLGFTPSSAEIALLDRAGKAVYSQTLAAAQAFTWVVPTTIPRRTVLVIAAGRPGFPLDSTTYLARLQVTS